jgi:hypothetical protein
MPFVHAKGLKGNFLLDKLYNLLYVDNAVTPCKSMSYAFGKIPPPPPANIVPNYLKTRKKFKKSTFFLLHLPFYRLFRFFLTSYIHKNTFYILKNQAQLTRFFHFDYLFHVFIPKHIKKGAVMQYKPILSVVGQAAIISTLLGCAVVQKDSTFQGKMVREHTRSTSMSVSIVADLDVADKKIAGRANGNLSLMDNTSIEQAAILNAFKQVPEWADADILVAPNFYYEFNGKDVSVTVIGYPARYKNFRTSLKPEDGTALLTIPAEQQDTPVSDDKSGGEAIPAPPEPASYQAPAQPNVPPPAAAQPPARSVPAPATNPSPVKNNSEEW